jgi:uncharacterized protein YnzC (UPF0291/DUF896 family)
MASAITRALATAVNELAAQLQSERIRHHFELKEQQQLAMDSLESERGAEQRLEEVCALIDELAVKHGIDDVTRKTAPVLLVEVVAKLEGKAP